MKNKRTWVAITSAILLSVLGNDQASAKQEANLVNKIDLKKHPSFAQSTHCRGKSSGRFRKLKKT